MFGIAALLVAAVIVIGLALAAKDGEDETTVLRAVGASPRVLRRVGALRPALRPRKPWNASPGFPGTPEGARPSGGADGSSTLQSEERG